MHESYRAMHTLNTYLLHILTPNSVNTSSQRISSSQILSNAITTTSPSPLPSPFFRSTSSMATHHHPHGFPARSPRSQYRQPQPHRRQPAHKGKDRQLQSLLMPLLIPLKLLQLLWHPSNHGKKEAAGRTRSRAVRRTGLGVLLL